MFPPTEERNEDKALSEEVIKSMSFENYFDPFLEDFLLKIVSRLISEFWQASFLSCRALACACEIIDEENRNFKDFRWSNLALENEKKKMFLKEESQDTKNKFCWQKNIYFHKMNLDEFFSLDSKKNEY